MIELKVDDDLPRLYDRQIGERLRTYRGSETRRRAAEEKAKTAEEENARLRDELARLKNNIG